MVSFNLVLSLGLLGSAFTSAHPTRGGGPPGGSPPATYGCGEVDVFFTGLPPSHPLVTAQGFDPIFVNKSLTADAAEVVKAGYNLRVVLMGPEKPMSVLEDQLKGINWDATGVGYGVRGSPVQNLTVRLEDILQTYREKVWRAPIVFNHSPTSTLWALQRHFPLSSNCTNSPGKDLGLKVFCDICG